MKKDIDWSALELALKGITFSESECEKIYKVGRKKVTQMIGTKIRAEQKTAGNGRVACNAYDVLIPIIRQCVIFAEIGSNTKTK